MAAVGSIPNGAVCGSQLYIRKTMIFVICTVIAWIPHSTAHTWKDGSDALLLSSINLLACTIPFMGEVHLNELNPRDNYS